MKKKIIGAVGIRLAVILFVIPKYPSDFFVPFLSQADFNFDFWTMWVNSGGDIRAFPYGLAMLIAYFPSLLIFESSHFLPIGGAFLFEFFIAFQFLAIEALLWRFIYKNKAMKESLNIFLFSPLIIWVNYFLGLNDLFPSACLFLSAYLLLTRKYKLAGVFIGLAIGMKFSLALVLPFLVLFAWDNPRFKKRIWTTTFLAVVVGTIMYIPGIYSAGFREMVFNNRESIKALEYTISFADSRLLILPSIYILLMYWIWKAGRISVEVLIAFFGIALFLISAFSPASLGWMLWGLPLMFMNLAKERKSRVQLLLIQCLFLLFSILNGIEIQTAFGALKVQEINNVVSDMIFTLGIILVVIYSYSSLKTAILYGDRYKIAAAPLTISIAGDSGTGKDTLAYALIQMFTPNSATVLCGDDYHKYERGDIFWESITHLNPAANYLDLWERDYKLAHKRRHFKQREYDHRSGKFSQLKPRFRRDLLISQGIHGLYPGLSEKSDVRIFMSMDNDLRIKLKLARDMNLRGKTRQDILNTIGNRQKDYSDFVASQVESSDIHFHLHELSGDIHLRVIVVRSYYIDKIISALIIHAKLRIVESTEENAKVFDIDPTNFDGKSHRFLLNSLLTDFDQLFLEDPRIEDGAIGIMSLISILLTAHNREEHLA
jgi:uridine kinase